MVGHVSNPYRRLHADPSHVRTERLLLRRFTDADRAPFASLNADPAVMELFPSVMTREQSDHFVDAIESGWEERGWGPWAIGLVDTTDVRGAASGSAGPVPGFVGEAGLNPADHVAPGAIEVGWRVAHSAWGHGFAPEAARAALRVGFETLGLDEVISFTVPHNGRSRRVMDKIGMTHRPERDFDNPRVDPVLAPHLVRHVLYSITLEEWQDASEWEPQTTDG
jgi:RimJ/RimL family protein N-acetyltransferase